MNDGNMASGPLANNEGSDGDGASEVEEIRAECVRAAVLVLVQHALGKSEGTFGKWIHEMAEGLSAPDATQASEPSLMELFNTLSRGPVGDALRQVLEFEDGVRTDLANNKEEILTAFVRAAFLVLVERYLRETLGKAIDGMPRVSDRDARQAGDSTLSDLSGLWRGPAGEAFRNVERMLVMLTEIDDRLARGRQPQAEADGNGPAV